VWNDRCAVAKLHVPPATARAPGLWKRWPRATARDAGGNDCTMDGSRYCYTHASKGASIGSGRLCGEGRPLRAGGPPLVWRARHMGGTLALRALCALLTRCLGGTLDSVGPPRPCRLRHSDQYGRERETIQARARVGSIWVCNECRAIAGVQRQPGQQGSVLPVV
jgi:hypothetical protein